MLFFDPNNFRIVGIAFVPRELNRQFPGSHQKQQFRKQILLDPVLPKSPNYINIIDQVINPSDIRHILQPNHLSSSSNKSHPHQSKKSNKIQRIQSENPKLESLLIFET